MTTAAFAPAQEWGAPQRPARAVISISPYDSAEPLPWLGSVVDRLNEVALLEAGWDGDNAMPPTQEAGLAAIRAVCEVMWRDTPVPAIVPMFDGGLQVEWHRRDLDIEMTVAPDGSRHVWISAAGGLIEIDQEFRDAVDDLRNHLGLLTQA